MIIIFALLIGLSLGYKPIILMHGIDGTEHDWDEFIGHLNQHHPGTDAYPLSCYNGVASWSDMLPQIQCIIGAIYDLKSEHKFDSFNFVAHSQGALSSRISIQMMKNSGVHNFLSISGPQLGQYGIPELDDYLPNLLRNLTNREITNLLYSKSFLRKFSFAEYWHDIMDHERYLKENTFLPVMNNETYNKESQYFKENFLEIDKLILFGSPHDEIIKPYFSAFFAFYKDGDMKEVVEMKDQYVYIKDSFGLRTLNENGKLDIQSVPMVHHTEWLRREDLFVDYIMQYLD